MTNLKNKILESVFSDKVQMTPRWRVLLYSCLMMTGLIFAILVVLFIASLLFFILIRSGLLHAPLFGMMAVAHSFMLLPGTLVIIALCMLVLVEILARKHEFGFRQPVLISLFFIVFFVVIISMIINQTMLHDSLYRYSRDHNIGPLRQIYERPKMFKKGDRNIVLRGTVVATSTETITLRLFDGATQTFSKSTTSMINIPLNMGEDVVVFGKMLDTTFEINAIRYSDDIPFRKHMPYRMDSMMR